jgi:hypothetical protein
LQQPRSQVRAQSQADRLQTFDGLLAQSTSACSAPSLAAVRSIAQALPLTQAQPVALQVQLPRAVATQAAVAALQPVMAMAPSELKRRSTLLAVEFPGRVTNASQRKVRQNQLAWPRRWASLLRRPEF